MSEARAAMDTFGITFAFDLRSDLKISRHAADSRAFVAKKPQTSD